jgi:hypothetical protein
MKLLTYVLTESSISTVISNQSPNTSVTDEKTMERIQRAIKDCLTNHPDCTSNDTASLPLRVIDTQNRCLHETTTEEAGRYAALSYVWGGDQDVKTTCDNIELMKREIEFSTLPKTLRDAVEVCIQLNIRYLWIDALCILQDESDDAISDKAKQLPQMGLIYGRAAIVIAASRAEKVCDGFLADSKINTTDIIVLPAWLSATCNGPLCLLPIPVECSYEEPLNQRAWCCQEICLAQRALIYTDGGIIWQCSTILLRLSFDDVSLEQHPSQDIVIVPKEIKAGAFQKDIWDQLVRIYTLRFLTDPNDRLNALAGIAAQAALAWDCRYYAGLWKHDMICQLSWHIMTVGSAPVSNESAMPAWREIVALGASYLDAQHTNWTQLEGPSWSWASVYGPVCNIDQMYSSETTRGARYISCKVQPRDENKYFGRISSGRLTLEGFMVKARDADDSWLYIVEVDIGSIDSKERNESIKIQGEFPDDIWCLVLGCGHDTGSCTDDELEWSGLLLRSLTNGTFIRLGRFSQDLKYSRQYSRARYESWKRNHSIGIDARFPAKGYRRTIVII